jgi:DNA-binding GntR family transcriptional regulator
MRRPAASTAEASPLYAHAQNALLRYFRAELTPGAELPAQAELAERCGASRTTIHRILRSFQEQRLIAKRNGTSVLLRRPAKADFLPQPQALSRREAVERSLMERLVAGRFRPGERFSELALAREHGVTTGTIREALLGMAHVGVFSKSARKQWTVAKIDSAMINELMDVRIMAERFALRGYFSAPPAGQDQIFARILAQTQEMADQPRRDRDAFFRLDRELHGAILGSAQNRYLAEQMRYVSFPIQLQLLHQGFDRDLQALGTTQHLALLQAIVAGDEPAAVRRLEDHLEVARRTLLGFSDKVGIPTP